jgi:hypothetical protein
MPPKHHSPVSSSDTPAHTRTRFDPRNIKGLDDKLNPNRLSAGSMARRTRRIRTHSAPKRRKTRIETDPTGSLFSDPVRAEILRNQDEIDELREQHAALNRKMKLGDYGMDDYAGLEHQDKVDLFAQKARKRQDDILKRETNMVRAQERQLEHERRINISLRAAQAYQAQSKTEVPLQPFFYSELEQKNARVTFRRARQSIFGPAGPLEGSSFDIRSFHRVREAQLRSISKVVDNEAIRMEIDRRMLIQFFAQSMLDLIPYHSDPVLRLTPRFVLLKRLARDPRARFGRKSVFLPTSSNPYEDYYSQIQPLVDQILENQHEQLLSQRTQKELLHLGRSEISFLKRDLSFLLNLQNLRKNRLLKSRFSAVRRLARQCWLYTPTNIDSLDMLKTTPVYFPNTLLRKTVLEAVGYKSGKSGKSGKNVKNVKNTQKNDQNSTNISYRQEALYWLEQIPIDNDIDDKYDGNGFNYDDNDLDGFDALNRILKPEKIKSKKHSKNQTKKHSPKNRQNSLTALTTHNNPPKIGIKTTKDLPDGPIPLYKQLKKLSKFDPYFENELKLIDFFGNNYLIPSVYDTRDVIRANKALGNDISDMSIQDIRNETHYLLKRDEKRENNSQNIKNIDKNDQNDAESIPKNTTPIPSYLLTPPPSLVPLPYTTRLIYQGVDYNLCPRPQETGQYNRVSAQKLNHITNKGLSSPFYLRGENRSLPALVKEGFLDSNSEKMNKIGQIKSKLIGVIKERFVGGENGNGKPFGMDKYRHIPHSALFIFNQRGFLRKNNDKNDEKNNFTLISPFTGKISSTMDNLALFAHETYSNVIERALESELVKVHFERSSHQVE